MVLTDTNKIIFQNTDHQPISKIPQGNWLVKVSDKLGFYLDKTNDFKLPEKIYGNSTDLANRYLQAYNAWDSNLGILLNGLKGTGKSLLAKQICIMSKLPVIIVAEPFGGTEFISFLSKIQQEAVVLFDEFEKVYKGTFTDKEPEEKLLSVLDGIFPAKFLFLLTTNNTTSLSPFLMDRPSRIHYRQEYGPLPIELIEEIALDLLDDKSKIEHIKQISQYLGNVTMDIIHRIIMDVNLRPEEDPRKVVSYMNLEAQQESMAIKQFIIDGIEFDVLGSASNPLVSEELEFSFYGMPVLYDNPTEVLEKHLSSKPEGSEPSMSNALYINLSDKEETAGLEMKLDGYDIIIENKSNKSLGKFAHNHDFKLRLTKMRPTTKPPWYMF